MINFNGHTDTGNPFSIEGFALDVLDYLNLHNIKHPIVFGYSMGGYVALFLERYYPQTFDKIITFTMKFHWDRDIATKEVKMLDPDIILQKIPLFTRQLEQRHGASNWRILLGKTKELILQLGDKNALETADYKHITLACLLLLGDRDKMVSKEETIAVRDAIPNALYTMLGNTTHPVEQVDMQILAGIIREFIG